MLVEVAQAIRGTLAIFPSHIRRQANAAVDYLSDVAVVHNQSVSQWQWQDVGVGDLHDSLTRLNQHDNQLHDRTGGDL